MNMSSVFCCDLLENICFEAMVALMVKSKICIFCQIFTASISVSSVTAKKRLWIVEDCESLWNKEKLQLAFALHARKNLIIMMEFYHYIAVCKISWLFVEKAGWGLKTGWLAVRKVFEGERILMLCHTELLKQQLHDTVPSQCSRWESEWAGRRWDF